CRLLRWIFTTDVLGIVVAYTAAAVVRVHPERLAENQTIARACILLGLAGLAVTLALAWQLGTYRRAALTGGHRVYPLLLTGVTYGVVSMTVLGHFAEAPVS